MQPPNNSGWQGPPSNTNYPPWQQQDYNQSTQQHPGYGQSQQPQWGQQSPVAPVPPPPRRSWLKTPSKSRTLLLGCLLPLCVALCCVIAGVSAATNSHNQVAAIPTPTAAATNTTSAALVATSSTEKPTQKPTANPTPKPTDRPTAAPTHPPVATSTPKPTCQGAINGNPWCYNFSPGGTITVPPSGFCNYFACITTFYVSDDLGDGYVVQCVDGLYSQSGSERGACSGHGGEGRTLYSH